MEFLVNDLSMDGQFHDLALFKKSIKQVMGIRQHIRKHGYTLFCHRDIASARVTPDLVMQQAVNCLSMDEKRAWMQWLTRLGPHWEDNRLYDEDGWLEVAGECVSKSAVGEAAVCCLRGLPRELVSFDPSTWLRSPINVKWVHADESSDDITVENHWNLDSVKRTLAVNPKPVASWKDVEVRSVERCSRLSFSKDAFNALDGQPFAVGAAKRIRELLNVLNKMKGCFNDDGTRNTEGHRLYQEFFTGKKGKGGKGSLFKDSSDSEKRDFVNKLTFVHPDNKNETLFCPWHGAVQTPQYRIHFSWPITDKNPLYIVYIGPKLTKK